MRRGWCRQPVLSRSQKRLQQPRWRVAAFWQLGPLQVGETTLWMLTSRGDATSMHIAINLMIGKILSKYTNHKLLDIHIYIMAKDKSQKRTPPPLLLAWKNVVWRRFDNQRPKNICNCPNDFILCLPFRRRTI
jgi:hypothetical protein